MNSTKTQQRAYILHTDRGNSGRHVQELNALIEEGWRITQTCSMPSGGNTYYYPHCLVVLEKENKKKTNETNET